MPMTRRSARKKLNLRQLAQAKRERLLRKLAGKDSSHADAT